MTIDQARMVIRNSETYDPQQIQKAVTFILGSLSCTQEDVMDATVALDDAQKRAGRRLRIG